MLITTYKNEAGEIDKVILTALGLEDAKRLIEFHAGEAQGYTQGWDKGFAGEGDPYGIQREYISQSPNPNAAKPFEIIEKDGRFYLSNGEALIGVFPTREDAEKVEAIVKGQ